MIDVLICNGLVIDGTGLPGRRSDLAIQEGRIHSIGRLSKADARLKIDAKGKIVAPGFVDAHVHGDLRLLEDRYHEPAIRQGVTTYVLGQDGVAMAPASPGTLEFMRQYTAGFSGDYGRDRSWRSMAEYLALFEKNCAINVCCLIPNGNVRMEVMGLDKRPPTSSELRQMRKLVREGMEQGAVGLSSGLDYVPSLFADADEMTELCEEIAPFDAPYVSHVRSYRPETILGALDELFEVGRRANCPVHVSHFNSQADLVLPYFDRAVQSGLDATYDLYCYLAGSTILAMIALPTELQDSGNEETIKRLQDRDVRAKLRQEYAKTTLPIGEVRLSYVAAEDWQHYEGLSLTEAAEQTERDLADFVCDVLVASNLVVGCIAPHLSRTEEDVKGLIRHPAMMAGSDGIYAGGFPHPRGTGCFARYLGLHVREEKTWSLEQAVQHLSAHAARRFGLKDRGLLLEGMAADVVIFDPETIEDRSTYDAGTELAVGMEHVFVNGEAVLLNGERTKALPGRGLRRR